MRHHALTFATVLLLALAEPLAATAHLRPVGGSLLELLRRADGAAIVEVLEATRDGAEPDTRVAPRKSLGGDAPTTDFRLRSAPSPMRYGAGQTAIVFVEREGDRWRAVQSAGEGLVFEAGELDAKTEEYVSSLWEAVHGGHADADLGLLLRAGLRLPHRKLRLLAAQDVAELAHHPPGLSAEALGAMRADREEPDLDPVVRLTLSRALGSPP